MKPSFLYGWNVKLLFSEGTTPCPPALARGVAEHSEAGGSLYEFAVNAGNRRYILQYSPSHRPVGGASPLINAGAKASIPLLS